MNIRLRAPGTAVKALQARFFGPGNRLTKSPITEEIKAMVMEGSGATALTPERSCNPVNFSEGSASREVMGSRKHAPVARNNAGASRSVSGIGGSSHK